MEGITILIGHFFSLMMNPNTDHFFTTSATLAEGILRLDEKDLEDDNKERLEEIAWIKKNTHKAVLLPLSYSEVLFAYTRPQSYFEPISSKIKDNKDNTLYNDKDQQMTPIDIKAYMQESYTKIVEHVIDVTKDSSVDFKFNVGGVGSIDDIKKTGGFDKGIL